MLFLIEILAKELYNGYGSCSEGKGKPGKLIDPKVLKLSDKGLEFVKDYEQPELKLYDEVPGKGDWTIGWGHKCTPEEVKKYKNSITIEQAEELLIKDLNKKIIPTSLQPFLVENNINYSNHMMRWYPLHSI